MLYQSMKTEICANDNGQNVGDSLLDMLAAQDMFAPEKALEIMHDLMTKEKVETPDALVIS